MVDQQQNGHKPNGISAHQDLDRGSNQELSKMQQSAKADRYMLQNYNKQASHSDGLQSMGLDDRDSVRNEQLPKVVIQAKYEDQRELGSNYDANKMADGRSDP